MKPDSAAFINLNLPAGALPWQILAILLLGFFVTLGLLIQKADWFKGYAKDFPTQTSTVMAGIAGFAATLLLNLCRGALGMSEMDGSTGAYTASCAFAGVGAGALGFKRFSSAEYQEGKAKIEAAKAAAQPAPAPPAVNVQGDVANISTTAERRVPGASRSTDTKAPPVPKAGVKPTNPDVVRGLETAAAQRATADDDVPEAS